MSTPIGPPKRKNPKNPAIPAATEVFAFAPPAFAVIAPENQSRRTAERVRNAATVRNIGPGCVYPVLHQ